MYQYHVRRNATFEGHGLKKLKGSGFWSSYLYITKEGLDESIAWVWNYTPKFLDYLTDSDSDISSAG